MKNPFVHDFRLKLVEKPLKKYKTVKSKDSIEGIITSYETVEETIKIEQQTKSLVYYIPYIENVLFDELKSSGRDLLLYLIYNIKPNMDFISLKLQKVSKEMKCSKPTLISAIKQLVSIGLICKKSQSEYWINPHYMFKGNRVHYYQTHYPECIEVVNAK